FGHDLVVLDVTDHALRRWVTDLPAHVDPRTRLLGTLTHVASAGEPDAVEVTFRHDAVVGNQGETLRLLGETDLDAATRTVQRLMRGSNLRAFAISRGPDGCRIVTRGETIDVPAFAVEAVDVTGAGDAFAAGIAHGMARRLDWTATARLANALGALSTRALGAQASLPTRDEVTALLGDGGETLGT
nr:carbohydrate kinase family protein [Chloroflexia bacterium]